MATASGQPWRKFNRKHTVFGNLVYEYVDIIRYHSYLEITALQTRNFGGFR